ncbi:hypothetical protein HCC61_11810 [Streptomyces sp. HNM0575]|uniref:hypothetical protein n=1 Tax=Streptomyces sp. HNM0575 TaxID=2716338 RepID=UPI00145D59F8|nr:hypothetical protein [Streptomyces sp. HNM0575]NLU73354.1 hypothetical protein [Streptomyces sp. HNM0575]
MEQEQPVAGRPVVVIDASSVPAQAAPELVSDALLAALARDETFAAVVRMPETTPEAMPETMPRKQRVADAGNRVRMLKRLRPGLSARCLGLAFVMPESAQRENARAIRAGAKLWGCPTLTTDDLARAQAWAEARHAAQPPSAAGEK